jgi:hypothetical protein
MRTIFAGVAIVFIGGCAGTTNLRGTGPDVGPTAAVPVVTRNPTLTEKQRLGQQQEAERAIMARTEVSGNISR